MKSAVVPTFLLSRPLRFLMAFAVFFYYIIALFQPISASAQGVRGLSNHGTPRLANYFLPWNIGAGEVAELAKWDVLVLDMENQLTSADKIRRIRELNPNIVILAYVTSQEIMDNPPATAVLRRKLASGIQSSWYLVDKNSERFSFWQGTSMLNLSSRSPVINGLTWGDYLANFVATTLAPSGLWDGIFYDNMWNDVAWFTKSKGGADFNRDGKADGNEDVLWRAGHEALLRKTRQLVPPGFSIISNTGHGHAVYRTLDDGALFESFPQFDWAYTMQEAKKYAVSGSDRLVVFNGSSTNGSSSDWRSMRFGLTSALLVDAYFAFDHSTNNHSQTWWYDEYNVELGEAIGQAYSLNGDKNFVNGSVWRRDFTLGSVLVNPGDKPKTVYLNAEFQKINGTQDRSVNNGQTVDRVTIPARDGIVLIKKTSAPRGIVFINGSLRSVLGTAKSSASQKNFYAYDASALPWSDIFKDDFIIRDQDEKAVTGQSLLQIFNKSGDLLFTDYPFGSAYTGGMNLAVSSWRASSPRLIAVAQRAGGAVVVYDNSGRKVTTIYPLGTKYKGGFNIAFGDVTGDGIDDLVVGTGYGVTGEVLVYDQRFQKIIKRFAPYGSGYKDSIKVATTPGEKSRSVVTLSLGAKPVARVFSFNGKKLAEYKLSVSASGPQYLRVGSDTTGNLIFDQI